MPSHKSLSVTVCPSPIQYEVIFGDNLLNQALAFAHTNQLRPFLILAESVEKLFPQIDVEKILLPQGEMIKSRAMKEKIEDALIERGCGRSTCLIAVGGGALLDLVGFTAATYCRGIPYLSIPTTLLAMTDAAIGGKTGLNVEEAKNWIGAFHHPRKIYLDLTLLRTLPEREFIYGLAETVKHGLIADAELFDFLERHLEALMRRDPALLEEMVVRSCRVKIGIVEKDPFEMTGLRRVLNFGHTIGHALETLSNYTRSHGQAVLMGMRVEAAIAHHLDYLSSAAYKRISTLLDRFPNTWDYPDQIPYEMLMRDKKGAHRFVILTGIGFVASFEGEYVTHLTKEHLSAGWKDVMCAC